MTNREKWVTNTDVIVWTRDECVALVSRIFNSSHDRIQVRDGDSVVIGESWMAGGAPSTE